ncbi:conserved hypothetical protein [Mesorhizobium sp. ORS 3359]|nr:conserved hypothetical protein [Mesorhizobium sp. ORS 3359]
MDGGGNDRPCRAARRGANISEVLPSRPCVSYESAGLWGVICMRYNWERAPTAFERHRKALAAAILIAGGVGLMLAALPL